MKPSRSCGGKQGLSMQLNREIEFDDKEKELDDFRRKALDDLKDKSSK